MSKVSKATGGFGFSKISSKKKSKEVQAASSKVNEASDLKKSQLHQKPISTVQKKKLNNLNAASSNAHQYVKQHETTLNEITRLLNFTADKTNRDFEFNESLLDEKLKLFTALLNSIIDHDGLVSTLKEINLNQDKQSLLELKKQAIDLLLKNNSGNALDLNKTKNKLINSDEKFWQKVNQYFINFEPKIDQLISDYRASEIYKTTSLNPEFDMPSYLLKQSAKNTLKLYKPLFQALNVIDRRVLNVNFNTQELTLESQAQDFLHLLGDYINRNILRTQLELFNKQMNGSRDLKKAVEDRKVVLDLNNKEVTMSLGSSLKNLSRFLNQDIFKAKINSPSSLDKNIVDINNYVNNMSDEDQNIVIDFLNFKLFLNDIYARNIQHVKKNIVLPDYGAVKLKENLGDDKAFLELKFTKLSFELDNIPDLKDIKEHFHKKYIKEITKNYNGLIKEQAKDNMLNPDWHDIDTEIITLSDDFSFINSRIANLYNAYSNQYAPPHIIDTIIENDKISTLDFEKESTRDKLAGGDFVALTGFGEYNEKRTEIALRQLLENSSASDISQRNSPIQVTGVIQGQKNQALDNDALIDFLVKVKLDYSQIATDKNKTKAVLKLPETEEYIIPLQVKSSPGEANNVKIAEEPYSVGFSPFNMNLVSEKRIVPNFLKLTDGTIKDMGEKEISFPLAKDQLLQTIEAEIKDGSYAKHFKQADLLKDWDKLVKGLPGSGTQKNYKVIADTLEGRRLEAKLFQYFV
jgi:hypothetical protein